MIVLSIGTFAAALGIGVLLSRSHPHPSPSLAGDDANTANLKSATGCPSPNPDTMVLFVMGQSNAGNHGEPATAVSPSHPDVLEFWKGSCYVASSPMLGATGRGASFLPLLGRKLIEAGAARKVVLSVYSVDGSPIKRYSGSGDLVDGWTDSLRALTQEYRPEFIIWMQGESDFAFRTSASQYVEAFREIERNIREAGVDAPIFVPIQTKCAERDRWHRSNEIAVAQNRLGADGHGRRRGVDLDQTLDFPGARYDGCHLSARGAEVAASAWTQAIVGSHNRSPRQKPGSDNSKTP